MIDTCNSAITQRKEKVSWRKEETGRKGKKNRERIDTREREKASALAEIFSALRVPSVLQGQNFCWE